MTEQPILITSIIAQTDVSKNTVIDASGAICMEDTPVLGVVNADTQAGEMCPVAVAGIVLVKSAGAITINHLVSSFDNGTVMDATNSTVFSTSLVGVALDSVASANVLIRVKLF